MRVELLPECTCGRESETFTRRHAFTCRRYVPNIEHFCTDCGAPVHYRSHHPACRHTDLV